MARFWLKLTGPLAAISAATGLVAPAQAEVTHVSDQGFAVLHVAKINATPDAVWGTLLAPQSYWKGSHSWSGDANNLYLDPQAGGCFCEKLPASSPNGSTLNSVEHMRVIYAERPRILRLSGALGPLQSEGVAATMNIAMEADGSGTKISLSYVVGGFMRMKPAEIAPSVDAVLGELLLRLKARAEGRDPASVTWPVQKLEATKRDGEPATPTDGAPPITAVAVKPKDIAPISAPATAPATAPMTGPKPTAPIAVPKPPLGERLKEGEKPLAPATTTPEVAPKKKPIVEVAPKTKANPVPPESR